LLTILHYKNIQGYILQICISVKTGQQFETNLGTHILENHSASIPTSNQNEHVENYER